MKAMFQAAMQMGVFTRTDARNIRNARRCEDEARSAIAKRSNPQGLYAVAVLESASMETYCECDTRSYEEE